MGRIVVVDEHDTPIGVKEREDIESGDICRASCIWITNPRGDILLAQRSMLKKSGPGLWGTAVAGTVDEGEDYLDNAVKEAQEELGLTIDPSHLILGPKRLVHGTKPFFCQYYFYETDIPVDELTLQEEEVADARWVTPEELRIEVHEHAERFFAHNSREWFEMMLTLSREAHAAHS